MLTEESINEVRALIKRNCTGNAYEFVAKSLGLLDLSAKFADINRRHDQAGFMTDAIEAERNLVYMEMMRKARMKLTKSEYQRLYQIC